MSGGGGLLRCKCVMCPSLLSSESGAVPQLLHVGVEVSGLKSGESWTTFVFFCYKRRMFFKLWKTHMQLLLTEWCMGACWLPLMVLHVF